MFIEKFIITYLINTQINVINDVKMNNHTSYYNNVLYDIDKSMMAINVIDRYVFNKQLTIFEFYNILNINHYFNSKQQAIQYMNNNLKYFEHIVPFKIETVVIFSTDIKDIRNYKLKNILK